MQILSARPGFYFVLSVGDAMGGAPRGADTTASWDRGAPPGGRSYASKIIYGEGETKKRWLVFSSQKKRTNHKLVTAYL